MDRGRNRNPTIGFTELRTKLRAFSKSLYMISTMVKPFFGGGGLMRYDIQVTVFNYEFDTGEMHSDTFTERARFADQHPTPLAQGAIGGLHDAHAATACGAASVLPAGQNTDVAFPKVGEIPAVWPAPVGGQLLPQAPGRGLAAVVEYPGHDAPAFALDGQPAPYFVLPGTHKRSSLVQFQRRPPFFSPLLGLQARPAGSGRQGFFLAVRQSCAARRRLPA